MVCASRGSWWCGVLAPLVPALLYAACWSFELLHYDDDAYVWRNPLVLGGWSAESLKDVWTDTTGNLWHPLTILSHQLAVSLGGTAPLIHHALNHLLFIVVAAILFEWARSFAELRAAQKQSAVIAGTVTLLWVCHPQRVEMVAWVSARKDLLCTLFILGALIAARRMELSREGRAAWLWAAASALAGLAACASKPSAVVLPALLVICRAMYRLLQTPGSVQQKRHGQTVVFWTLFGLMLVASLITAVVAMKVQSAGGHAVLAENWQWHHRLGLPPLVVLESLSSTILPAPQQVMRMHPEAWYTMRWYQGVLVVVGLSAAALMGLRKRHSTRAGMFALSWCWWLLCLAPVSGFFPVGNEYFVDRYNTLPHLGLLPALVCLMSTAAEGWRSTFQIAMACAVAAVFAGLSLQWLPAWRNDLTLFGAQARLHPRNHKVLVNHANALRRNNELDAARRNYEQALESAPTDYKALFSYATLLIQLAQTEPLPESSPHNRGELLAAAEGFLTRALRSPEARAQAWSRLAQNRLLAGRPDAAMTTLREGLSRYPNDAGLWELNAQLLQTQGDNDAARKAYHRALELAPDAEHLRKRLETTP